MFQILVYFLCKNYNPPEKGRSHPLLLSNPPLKIEILSSPRGLNPQQKEGDAHYVYR